MPKTHWCATSPRAIDKLEQATQVMALRRAGHAEHEIAERLGLHKGAVHSIIAGYMAEMRAENWEAAAHRIERDNATLDGLQAEWYPRALAGSVKAAEVVLKILQRRALLNGLDAAAKLELQLPTDYDQVKAKYKKLIERRARELTIDTTAAPITEAEPTPPPPSDFVEGGGGAQPSSTFFPPENPGVADE